MYYDRTVDRSKLRLGVSACLLGNEVRYDGGHKRNPLLTDLLGPFVEWVPVCPEVEAGFGTPREPMRLVTDHGTVRLVTVQTQIDVTTQLQRVVDKRLRELPSLGLDGFVLKKGSPSCGLFGERGLFAAALAAAEPQLPLEEEGRLDDPPLRDVFFARVFAYRAHRGIENRALERAVGRLLSLRRF